MAVTGEDNNEDRVEGYEYFLYADFDINGDAAAALVSQALPASQ